MAVVLQMLLEKPTRREDAMLRYRTCRQMAKNNFPDFVPPKMANSAAEPFDSPD
jgi:hypothetical protein